MKNEKNEQQAAHLGPESAPSHKKKRRRKKKGPIRKTLTIIGMVLLSLILIAVISVSIIAAALTVYVMQFRENTPIDIDLESLDLAYTTFIYGYDENGQEVELTNISRAADRIPVSIERIPRHVRDAFVYIEDERFYEHAGVDWKRTFGAFVNLLTGEALYGSKQGGSTITQQLVKNVTGDDDDHWDRKLREIFRASDLEKYRDKDDILEAYLNCIGFGGNTSGIQAASLKYFGKDVSELDLAEAACLAAIPKSPEALNPRVNPERNKERQSLVLRAMYNNAAISKQQYENALAEELHFYDPSQEDNPDDIQNWYIDMVIRDVTNDLSSLYGVTWQEANDMLYNGGYTIYTPIDIEMQEALEAKYRDYTTFSSTLLNDPPQSAFVAMDYTGNVLAVVGGIGEKAGSNIWNHATMSPRQPGSSFKPVAGYGYSIEHNLITWSTIHSDLPIEIPDENNPGHTRKWPTNYSSTSRSNVWSGNSYFTFQALQRSLNTVSARLVQAAGSGNVFEFVQNKFRFSTLKAEDADLSPMSVGALTDGVTVRELVAAYQVFGNGGKYFSPASYTYVQDPAGEVVLQHKYTPIQSISEESAYVMNKLMQQVVEGPNGTGKAAKLENVPVVGKTGTSQEWRDNWFVCCTPDYVSGVWYGYEDYRTVASGTYYNTAQLWKNIFGDIAEQGTKTEFPECESVKQLYFCSNTGMIASGSCPTFNQGYYKSTNTPPVCTKCGGFTISDKNIEPVTTTIAADLIDIDELTNELLNGDNNPENAAAALSGN
ncbi:MAG: transglycosylase domain-containing protein [Oscillospiraceae bacterium]|nr:transglycosylase domain-containing protein [Oscillospiraceae bacterium]